jgi:hypothetical protein
LTAGFFLADGENQRSVAIAVMPDISMTTNSTAKAQGEFRSSHRAKAKD